MSYLSISVTRLFTQVNIRQQESQPDIADYSEEDLLLFYEDLLAVPPSSQQKPDSTTLDDATILQGVADRIMPTHSSFRDQLSQFRAPDPAHAESVSITAEILDTQRNSTPVMYKTVLARLQDVVANTDGADLSVRPESERIPMQEILSELEWSALARSCVCEVLSLFCLLLMSCVGSGE